MFGISISEMTECDLEIIAVMHSEVFPKDTDTALGKRYLMKMYSFFLEESDRLALVARGGANKQIFGFLVGAPTGFMRQFRRHTAGAVLTAVVSRPGMWFDPQNWRRLKIRASALLRNRRRTGHVETNATSADGQTGYLYYLAVSQTARRKGIGEALMSRGEEFFRVLGMKRVIFSVFLVNVDSIRLYEKWGWKQQLGGDGIRRIYGKDLD